MSDEEKNIERLEAKFPTLSASAFAAARDKVLASGDTVLQAEEGNIYEVYPDGKKVFVKKIEPPKNDVVGRKITI